jgi:hypothetical protein
MYLCKKTNRSFDTKQGFLNHLKYIYGDMEQAYLTENNIKPSKCLFCVNNAKFKSFFLGYHDICMSEKCISLKRSKSSKNIKRKKRKRIYDERFCMYCGKKYKIELKSNQLEQYFYCGNKKCVGLFKNG